MSFDLSIAFDKAEYLTPQIYLLVDTLKDNLPKDTILHVITNRSRKNPEIKYIKDNIPCKIYIKRKDNKLNSRCNYMYKSFEIDTDKEWVIKIECDLLILKNLKNIEKLLKQPYDLFIGQECRKMIDDDNIELRVWRNIYKDLEVKMPTKKITYIENKKKGLPLYDTSIIIVKSKWLDYINKNWVPMTEKCEKWMHLNIHPNEFAFTALIHKGNINHKLFNPNIYDFNPISHFRKGEFPSQELIDNPIIPDDVEILQYHRPWWLKRICESNPKIKEIVENSNIGDWLNTRVDISEYVEKTG